MMDQKNLSVLLQEHYLPQKKITPNLKKKRILQLSLVSINSIIISMVNNLPSYLSTNLYHDMLNEKKQIPALASSRIQRWALILRHINIPFAIKQGNI